MHGQQALMAQLSKTLSFAATQVRKIVETYPGFFPMYTAQGKWKHGGEAWTNWCEGFLPGMMWHIHQQTSDPWFRKTAEEYSRKIEHRKDDRKRPRPRLPLLPRYLQALV